MNLPFEKYSGKTVLVTGATGFTGQVLVEKLIKTGAQVRAIARTSSNLGKLEDYDIQWFRGNIFEQDLIERATQSVHYIFHLAAAYREVKPDDEGYRKVHLEGTQLLAQSAVNNTNLECFVHVSTVGVHGHIEVDRADENYRFSPGDGYQRTKLEAEQWITQFATDNQMPFSVLRPASIIGPGDKRLLKLYRMVYKGYLLLLGGGKGIYHLIHVDDFSNIILLAGITPKARSEVMIAANDEPVSILNMAKIISSKINRNFRTIRLPLFPFYLAADICELVCAPLGLQPPIYRRRIDFYTKDRQFDNSKMKRLLEYKPKYDNDSGIEDTAKWYMENNLLK